MKQRLSIFCTWAATLMVLLSTVVMHHHHYERVCVALEICQHGDASDIEAEPEESHSHQEADKGSCRVHQLHKFIISHSLKKDSQRRVADGKTIHLAAAIGRRWLPMRHSRIVADWQHKAEPLSMRALTAVPRRGPPMGMGF